MILDLAIDALLDTLKTLPFLFIAFIFMEFCEHKAANRINRWLSSSKFLGAPLGAVFGLIPQCGFSAAAANLYAGGLISLGTLLSVLLSTSDEALLILLSRGDQLNTVWRLLLCKFLIGCIYGLIIDFFYATKKSTKDMHTFCASCGCHGERSLLSAALYHTFITVLPLFIFTFFIGLIMELIGTEVFSSLILNGSVFQPFLSSLIGLIPNCASSVLLTQLFLSGGLSFASLLAGLCSNSGVALLLLFKSNPSQKENFSILLILYGISVTVGFILQFIF